LTKKKISADIEVITPQNLEEADKVLSIVAERKRALELIETDLNIEIEKLRRQSTILAAPHQNLIDRLVLGLFAYATQNREKLTDGGKTKTITLTSGTLSWRFTPPAIKFNRTVSAILQLLKERKLRKFIRKKEEPDKEAMLRDLVTVSKVPGISTGQYELFVVKPNEVTEITDKVRSLSRKVT
jgi:phage host-nuclease inhibitor protein Gam